MTDWNLINKYLQKAMHAVNQAHSASENLKEDATPESFNQFRKQMDDLTDHLTNLQTVLDHQDTYALDELADWLSTTFGGEHTTYRHTPHLEMDKPKE